MTDIIPDATSGGGPDAQQLPQRPISAEPVDIEILLSTNATARELALIDRIAGLRARIHELESEPARDPNEVLSAEHRLSWIMASSTWRVGGLVVGPLRSLRNGVPANFLRRAAPAGLVRRFSRWRSR